METLLYIYLPHKFTNITKFTEDYPNVARKLNSS